MRRSLSTATIVRRTRGPSGEAKKETTTKKKKQFATGVALKCPPRNVQRCPHHLHAAALRRRVSNVQQGGVCGRAGEDGVDVCAFVRLPRRRHWRPSTAGITGKQAKKQVNKHNRPAAAFRMLPRQKMISMSFNAVLLLLLLPLLPIFGVEAKLWGQILSPDAECCALRQRSSL